MRGELVQRGEWGRQGQGRALLGLTLPPLTLSFPPSPAPLTPGSATVLVAGGFAGIASWVTATPLDVVKSRMQMAGLGQREFQGLLDCMVSSARQEGLGVFFRGLTINSARAFPVNAVTFLSYEYLLHAWG